MIRVVATATHTSPAGWTCSAQIPTFWVDAFSMDEASRKARDVIDPHKLMQNVSLGLVDEGTERYASFNFPEIKP